MDPELACPVVCPSPLKFAYLHGVILLLYGLYAGLQQWKRRTNRAYNTMRALALGMFIVRFIGNWLSSQAALAIMWTTLICFALIASMLWARNIWRSTMKLLLCVPALPERILRRINRFTAAACIIPSVWYYTFVIAQTLTAPPVCNAMFLMTKFIFLFALYIMSAVILVSHRKLAQEIQSHIQTALDEARLRKAMRQMRFKSTGIAITIPLITGFTLLESYYAFTTNRAACSDFEILLIDVAVIMWGFLFLYHTDVRENPKTDVTFSKALRQSIRKALCFCCYTNAQSTDVDSYENQKLGFTDHSLESDEDVSRPMKRGQGKGNTGHKCAITTQSRAKRSSVQFNDGKQSKSSGFSRTHSPGLEVAKAPSVSESPPGAQNWDNSLTKQELNHSVEYAPQEAVRLSSLKMSSDITALGAQDNTANDTHMQHRSQPAGPIHTGSAETHALQGGIKSQLIEARKEQEIEIQSHNLLQLDLPDADSTLPSDVA